MRFSEANRTDDFASFILHHIRTLHALQCGFRVLATERCGRLIIRICGIGILWPAPSGFGKVARPIQRLGMALRGGLFE
jgi:hypothetical protein